MKFSDGCRHQFLTGKATAVRRHQDANISCSQLGVLLWDLGAGDWYPYILCQDPAIEARASGLPCPPSKSNTTSPTSEICYTGRMHPFCAALVSPHLCFLGRMNLPPAETTKLGRRGEGLTSPLPLAPGLRPKRSKIPLFRPSNLTQVHATDTIWCVYSSVIIVSH
jgi:hypothetical protein